MRGLSLCVATDAASESAAAHMARLTRSPTDHMLSPCSRALRKRPHGCGFQSAAQRPTLPTEVPILLGSTNVKHREAMLSRGIAFTAEHVDAPEPATTATAAPEDARTLALELAQSAMVTLQRRHIARRGDAVIAVTVAQVAVFGGDVRRAPASADEARDWLRSYARPAGDGADGGDGGDGGEPRRRPVTAVTAVVVCDTLTGARAADVDETSIVFGALPDERIEACLDRAARAPGALAVDEPELRPWLASIDGSFDAALGLPLDLLQALVARVAAHVAAASSP